MSARYRVKVFDTNGTLIYLTDDYNSLGYTKLLNDVGNFDVSFSMKTIDSLGLAEQVFNLDNFYVIERSDPAFNLDWYVDFEGFLRTISHSTSERGYELCTVYGRSYEDLLRRRHITYKAGTAGASKTAPVETLIKQYVDENAGPSATIANGREVSGVTPGFTVTASNGLGASKTTSYPWRNLLDVVRELTNGNNFYFWITRSGATFTFHATPTYGTDRSADSATPVIFSETFANMVTPTYTLSRIEETNRIVVLGQGEDAARTVVVRQDAVAQASSPWNIVERTHDARNASTTPGLETEGDQELVLGQAKENFAFQVLQSDTSRYGIHYFHGDIVTAKLHSIVRDKRIVSVTVRDDDGKENLSFQFSDEAVDPDPIRQVLENLASRIRYVEVRQNL